MIRENISHRQKIEAEYRKVRVCDRVILRVCYLFMCIPRAYIELQSLRDLPRCLRERRIGRVIGKGMRKRPAVIAVVGLTAVARKEPHLFIEG